jgi:DNA polymerase-4
MDAQRKILHIDMDCFYAAIEIRDHPELKGKPVAVGGSSGRGVLTTCSYEARKFGCHSAMPTFKALRLCPDLILMPVRFDVYRKESARIRSIFQRFTDLIEPLSLDEAFLDITSLRSSGASVAGEIRDIIHEETELTASAGIAPNKMLAKIASDWRKPDGQFQIEPEDIAAFMRPLPVKKLWGVGKVTAKQLEAMGALTCGDLQEIDVHRLAREFGKFGPELSQMARGLDDRKVNPSRERKSLSNERTYVENVRSANDGIAKLEPLLDELEEDLRKEKNRLRTIRTLVLKLKFEDFSRTTIERAADHVDRELFQTLLHEAWPRGGGKSIRLIGAGVRFQPEQSPSDDRQLSLFDFE